MIKIKVKNLKGGYTLVETLVAISIFSISILGLLFTLSQGISDTGYAKKKIAAAFLAQEGLEYIRNLRDTYVIYDSGIGLAPWDKFSNTVRNACRSNRPCYVNADDLDYSNPSQPMLDIELGACPAGPGCPELRLDPSTAAYNYSVGGNSGFIREITATPVSGDELSITSTVYWKQGSGQYSVSFTENLFNWIE